MALTIPQLTGATQKQIAELARAVGAKWYGVEKSCIKLALTDERLADADDEIMTFSAGAEVWVEHHFNQPAYGFAKCTRCGTEA